MGREGGSERERERERENLLDYVARFEGLPKVVPFHKTSKLVCPVHKT